MKIIYKPTKPYGYEKFEVEDERIVESPFLSEGPDTSFLVPYYDYFERKWIDLGAGVNKSITELKTTLETQNEAIMYLSTQVGGDK